MAVLTISREFGSGGKDIGHAVAKLSGYDYVDRKRILDDMHKAGKQWEERAVHFDESYPGISERYDLGVQGIRGVEPEQHT